MDWKLFKKEVASDTLWRILQVTSEVLIQFFIFFFLAKWLEQKEFGLYSLITAILTIFGIFTDFGISNSSTKFLAENFAKGKGGNPKSIILVSVILSFGFLGVVCLIYIGSADIIGKIKQNEGLGSLLKFSTPLLFFMTLSVLLDGLFRGARNIKVLAIIEIVSRFFQFISLIVFVGVFNYGLKGAIGGITIGYIWLVVICFLFLFKKIYNPLKENLNLKSAFKSVFFYGLPNILISIAGFLYTKVDILILGYFRDASQVAKYNFAVGIFYLPFYFLSAYAAVLSPVITKEYTLNNSSSLQSIFTKSASISAYLMLFASLGILLFSGPVIQFFFPKYESSVILLKILSFALIFKGVGLIAGMAFLVPTGNASINARVLILGAILNTILDLILIPKYGALGSVVATVFVHTIANLICVTLTLRRLDLKFQLRGILFPIKVVQGRFKGD